MLNFPSNLTNHPKWSTVSYFCILIVLVMNYTGYLIVTCFMVKLKSISLMHICIFNISKPMGIGKNSTQGKTIVQISKLDLPMCFMTQDRGSSPMSYLQRESFTNSEAVIQVSFCFSPSPPPFLLNFFLCPIKWNNYLFYYFTDKIFRFLYIKILII